MFCRVFAPELENSKSWYLLDSDRCCKLKPAKFAALSVFEIFPDELKNIELKAVRSAAGEKILPAKAKDRNKKCFVATAFGILGGLLSRREVDRESLLPFVDQINDIALDSPFPPKPELAPPPPKSSTPTSQGSLVPSTPTSSNNSATTPTRWSPISSCSLSSGDMSFEDITNSSYKPHVKRRKIRERSKELTGHVYAECEVHDESLSTVLTNACLSEWCHKDSAAKEVIKEVFAHVASEKGVKRTFEELLSEDVWADRVSEMRNPDWQYFLLKLEGKISDESWQTLLNRTKLGRNGSSDSTPILPLKNHVKAMREMMFPITKKLMDIRELPNGLPGFQVSMESIVVWIIREQLLHGSTSREFEFHLKIDGRPLFGKDQVSIGIVPANHPYLSSQSSKAVYTLAIANAEESRENITTMIKDLNSEKDKIKKDGILVDGNHYRITFKAVLDYKGFCLLLPKKDDPCFKLGGQGLNVEFCMFCHAIRYYQELQKKGKFTRDYGTFQKEINIRDSGL